MTESTLSPQVLTVGPLEIRIATWIYVTVTVMSILVVYDGWSELSGPGGIVLVVVGPTIALGTAHVFADVLDHQIRHGRNHRRDEVAELFWDFLQYLLVAVPALVVLAVTYLVLGQSPSEAIRSMLMLGVLSLGFWGGLAGWRGGNRGWRLLAAIVAGLVVGLLVFAFQILLKPH